MSLSNVEVGRKRKKTTRRVTRVIHHTWTNQEDAIIVQRLHVMLDDSKWKGDNGIFRSWYLSQLEKMLEKVLV